jgi:hypothetical protein
MASRAEEALWALEEAVEGVHSFVKGTAYGLRLAAKRVGDVAGTAPSRPPGRAPAQPELRELAEALEHAEDRLSDLVILALGDHFRAFLARALQLAALPDLPASPPAIEELAGTPGALGQAPDWVALLLQLYRVVLKGGALDREALRVLGKTDLELAFPGGKMKLFRPGDHVALTEQQLREIGQALIETARAIHLRLATA